ncbi:hypothetical protein E2C01_056388 [Portunus trituberculatus]|uniref:Uncharacterized protein n=1 Tax=Portunus trituberculatus TaxID=210409 RepID=A0A5B7H0E3_PORTR|nr:hypothetical protein [Portunus trituberculatus]
MPSNKRCKEKRIPVPRNAALGCIVAFNSDSVLWILVSERICIFISLVNSEHGLIDVLLDTLPPCHLPPCRPCPSSRLRHPRHSVRTRLTLLRGRRSFRRQTDRPRQTPHPPVLLLQAVVVVRVLASLLLLLLLLLLFLLLLLPRGVAADNTVKETR